MTPDPPRIVRITSLYWRLRGAEFWREMGNVPNDPAVLVGFRGVPREAGYEAKGEDGQ